MNHLTLASLFTSVAVLTACGGGGSDSSSLSTPATAPAGAGPATGPAPAVTYNAQVAWTKLLSTSRSWTVSGRGSDGADYQLALSVDPAGADIFPVTGASAVKSNLRNRLSKQGTLVQDVLNEQFTDTQYRLLGSRVSTDGGAPNCSKTEVVAAVPSVGALPGSNGPLYAATTLSDCTATGIALGSSYHTWSVVNDNGIVFLCVASSNRFINETRDLLSETCVETDASGNLGQRARITLALPGFSIVATN